jgi:hypothetical protein
MSLSKRDKLTLSKYSGKHRKSSCNCSCEDTGKALDGDYREIEKLPSWLDEVFRTLWIVVLSIVSLCVFAAAIAGALLFGVVTGG